MTKPVGLFINTLAAECSIHESGRMVFNSLRGSAGFELHYVEVGKDKREIPAPFDFYIFNYHHLTMGWLKTSFVKNLPGIKITMVLESLPDDPFVLCPKGAFDAYAVLDPTLKSRDKNVFSLPRPLEKTSVSIPTPNIPTIGSFGFPTPGKGFELLVDAVGREFDEAHVRLHIPHGQYAQNDYAKYLESLCRRVAKPKIKLEFSHHYLTKEQLIQWCGQNSLNAFLYSRMLPGLAATTDQAIASGRPLAVSGDYTFRHIHSYLAPYPRLSLRESIAQSGSAVQKMQKDWAPEEFRKKFESVLKQMGVEGKQIQGESHPPGGKIILPKLGKICGAISNWQNQRKLNSENLSQIFVNTTDLSKLPKIAFISSSKKQCGVYQFGKNTVEALRVSQRYRFIHLECDSEAELLQQLEALRPEAVLYNYYPATMPWLNSGITRSLRYIQMQIMHEVTQGEADRADQSFFDYHLCPDPSLIEKNPITFRIPRLIPNFLNMNPNPKIPTIGSFGFGFKHKGFEKLIEQVQQEFDEALIRLHMPFNDVVDRWGWSHARKTARDCRKLIRKNGIRLEITHHFLSKWGVLEFLSKNSINAFFYDPEVNSNRGISSTIDYALAARRPLAITRCEMFRHIWDATPSVLIENSNLREIMTNDVLPLVPFYNDWSETRFVLAYESVLDKIFAKRL